MKRIVVDGHGLVRLDVMFFPISHSCAVSLWTRGEIIPASPSWLLLGQVVFAFSPVDERNLVGLLISAYAAAESAGRAHRVMVVEGLVGARNRQVRALAGGNLR